MKYLKYLFLILILFFLPFVASTSSELDEPNEIELNLSKAGDAINNKQYQDAIKYLDNILEQDPNHIKALRNKGALLAILERYDEALVQFDKVLEIDPKHILGLYNKGRTLAHLERFDEAILNLDKVITLDPVHIPTFILKASILGKTQTSIEGIIQIQIRNSQNQLVGYVESNRLSYYKYYTIEQFLQSLPVKQTVTYGGDNFAIVEKEYIQEYPELTTTDNVWGNTYIYLTYENSTFPAIGGNHFGFPVEEGDTVIITWKFILPLF